MDYAKALDTVDWDFLLDLLVAKGFGVRWVGWIMTILQSLKASILINGSLNDYICY